MKLCTHCENKLGGIIILILVIFPFLFYCLGDIQAFGNYGSWLAGVGSIIAIYLLRKTYQAQKEELKLTREELELTRGELHSQTQQMETQNEYYERQEIESRFFKLLNLYNQSLISLEGEIPKLSSSTKVRYTGRAYIENMITENGRSIVYNSTSSGYLNTIEMIFEYMHTNSLNQNLQNFFLKQLSDSEIIFIIKSFDNISDDNFLINFITQNLDHINRMLKAKSNGTHIIIGILEKKGFKALF